MNVVFRGSKARIPDETEWPKFDRILKKILKLGIGKGILEPFLICNNKTYLYSAFDRTLDSTKCLPPIPRVARSMLYLARNLPNLEAGKLPYYLDGLMADHLIEDRLFSQIFTSQNPGSNDMTKIEIDPLQLYRHYENVSKTNLCIKISLSRYCREYGINRNELGKKENKIQGKETLYLPTVLGLVFYEFLMILPKLFSKYMFIYQLSNNAQSESRTAYSLDLFSPNEMNLWLGVSLNANRLRTIFNPEYLPQSTYFRRCAEEMYQLLDNDITFLDSFINPITSLILEHWKLELIKEELGSYKFMNEETKKEILSSELRRRDYSECFGNLGISYNLIFSNIENDQKLIENVAFEKFGLKKNKIIDSYPKVF